MKFDGALGLAKLGPGKHRKTQIDRRCVERINGCIQIDAQVFVGIQRSRLVDEDLSEVGIDFLIARRVGMRQIVSRNAAANTHVVQFWAHCSQACFDLSQAVAIRQLRESHDAELLGARKRFGLSVAAIPSDAGVEPTPGQKFHQLREHKLACVHSPFDLQNLGNQTLSADAISNRYRSSFYTTLKNTRTYNQSTQKRWDASWTAPLRANNSSQHTHIKLLVANIKRQVFQINSLSQHGSMKRFMSVSCS